MILMPQRLYEILELNFDNETIVESCHISGHHVVYNNISIGSSYISGILHHEGTYAASACVDGIEREPCWRVFVGSDNKYRYVIKPEKPKNRSDSRNISGRYHNEYNSHE